MNVRAQLTVALLLIGFGVNADADNSQSVDLPDEWIRVWRAPGVEYRPLQIVHGVPAGQTSTEAMQRLKDLGLGGIVCNAAFGDYLRSEKNWQDCIAAVEACAEVGLRVWIYDEDGYPSGAAGGLVLQEHPDCEALALAYDPEHEDVFILRPSYEHTHASNNYYAARRYPNLLDGRAVARFVEVTHDAYYQRLGPHFGRTIEAFFTDEPSLLAVNIGPLPDDVRNQVRVADPLDPNVRPMPSVPWVEDLPDLYEQRYGQNLQTVRKSLFEGDTDADRVARRRFWALVADLLAGRYFGRIGQWTRAHGVASSGHILWEEMLAHHPALEGNTLEVLGQMDIPGLDMLSSNPEAAIHTGWMTATFPASAALLNGRRQVMTEVSDFSETMAGKGPAALADMCATAAWQAALGVTEFTLYYDRNRRTPEEYRSYCTYVGRLNALLREAEPAPRVLLYYPIVDIWSEYKPVATKLTLESQSQRLRDIVASFMSLGQRLTRAQVSFALADHEMLATARVADGKIHIADREFKAVVLPARVELPPAVARQLDRFEASGGDVLRGPDVDVDRLRAIYDHGALGEPAERMVVGRFVRADRAMVVVVNVSTEAYNGPVTAPGAAPWIAADPATGALERITSDEQDRVPLSLAPRRTLVLVGPSGSAPVRADTDDKESEGGT